ncbi:hypothetical protein BB560_005289, partial [Smittium megazygosporum]
MHIDLKYVFGLLFMATTTLSSMEPNLETENKNANLFRRQRGTTLESSRFTRNCVLNRQSLTTSSKISCNTVFSSNIYCSETFVTIPCSKKYFYMTFNADINPSPTWWHIVASNGATVPNSNNVEYKFLLHDGFEIDTTTSATTSTRGTNLHAAPYNIPYGVNITYFILHDENGSKIGMNNLISESQSNIGPLNDILMKSPANLALTADKLGIINLSNIQIRCLADDTCQALPSSPANSIFTTTVSTTLSTTVTQSTTTSTTVLTTSLLSTTIPTTVTVTTIKPTTSIVPVSPIISTKSQTVTTTALTTVITSTTIPTTVTTTTIKPTTSIVPVSPITSTISQTVTNTVLTTSLLSTPIPTTATVTTIKPTTSIVPVSPIMSTISQTVTTTALTTVITSTTIPTTVTVTAIKPTTSVAPVSPIIIEIKSTGGNKGYDKSNQINIPCSGDFTLSLTSNSIDSDLFFGFADANGISPNSKYLELQIGLKSGQNAIKDLVSGQAKRNKLFKRDDKAKINIVYVSGIYSLLSNGQSYTTFKGSSVTPKSLTITPYSGS